MAGPHPAPAFPRSGRGTDGPPPHPHTPRSAPEHRTPAATSRRGALLLGGALAAGALLGTTGGATAAAAAAQPWVYTRQHWLARPPVQPAQILDHAPTYIVVHHTASDNVTDYTRAHAFDLSRTIQDLHMDTNGWDDTGQQLTISRGGHIMEGRNESLNAIGHGMHVMGAHTASYNDVAVGIENEGTYITEEPTAALWASLVETCAWLCAVYGLPVSAIMGHRDFNATICPRSPPSAPPRPRSTTARPSAPTSADRRADRTRGARAIGAGAPRRLGSVC
ncbi:peptidoglycan recognition family protein [Streptomonospora nanhaiensis]|uniref:peptidoglycan recognition protein family protein n=1 Tax=Streptomonospora nanhaiensis TaxID=1323731 RepID=UPI0035588576